MRVKFGEDELVLSSQGVSTIVAYEALELVFAASYSIGFIAKGFVLPIPLPLSAAGEDDSLLRQALDHALDRMRPEARKLSLEALRGFLESKASH